MSKEKLSLAQEELAANRTHQSGLEAQIQEVNTVRTSLEQELAKREERLQKQDQTLKELQKQQVRLVDKLMKHTYSHSFMMYDVMCVS